MLFVFTEHLLKLAYDILEVQRRYLGSFRFPLLTWNLCLQLTLQLLRPN